jgi:hypothetical protein
VAKFSAYETLTTEQLTKLAVANAKRFSDLLADGPRYMRKEDCEKALSIWQSIEKKALDSSWPSNLTEDEQSEIEDACNGGEYDDIVG